MEKGKVVISKGGISFMSLFFLVLFVLKMTNVINWSWWWITAPLWIGIAIVFTGIFVFALIIFLFTLFGKK